MLKTGRQQIGWIALFLACIGTRLLTVIRYIEDPDSLRFALAVVNYDLAAMQPHFPAYPLFCFVVKGFYLMVGNFSISFALVGGVFTFVLIFFSVKTASLIWKDLSQPLLSALFFINPLIWLMGNRFMPDLSGAAIAMTGLWLFAKWFYAKKEGPEGAGLFFALGLAFCMAMLAGWRLSYIPLLVLPFLYLFFAESIKGKALIFLYGIAGVLLWFIPLMLDTGWAALLNAAQLQTEGHFNDFGGTMNSEPQTGQRLIAFIRHGWADGLGGWWAGRHWITGVSSVLLAGGFLLGMKRLFHDKQTNRLLLILFLSFGIYALWIFFYQNILYKSRHHLSLLPFLLTIIGLGLHYFIKKYGNPAMVLTVLLLTANLWVTGKLVMQHRSPTAISQLKDFLEKEDFEHALLITSDLVQYYLTKQKVDAEFIDINSNIPNLENWLRNGKKVYVAANLDIYKTFKLEKVAVFYHNPYVNRMWPVVLLNEIKLND